MKLKRKRNLSKIFANNDLEKEIYLIGGGGYDDEIDKKVEKRAFLGFNNPSVLIVHWTSNNQLVLKRYRKILLNFFKKLDAFQVNFLELNDSYKEMREKIGKSNMIYLPGGDTEFFLENLKKKRIKNLLKNFKGVIIGVSAGAYGLTKGYMKINQKQPVFIAGLNLVDILIKAHYRKEMDQNLIRLSQRRIIYGISDNSALVWRKGQIKKIIGRVYLFKNGKKVGLLN